MDDTLTDELLNQVTWRIPNALVLVGSRHGDEWNGMTTSWVTQVSMEPVLIGIGVDNKAVTHRLITASGAFTVNLWSPEDTRVFVKFSKPARYEDGKLNERPVHRVAPGHRSSKRRSPGWSARCGTRPISGTHTFFVGEVVAAGLPSPDVEKAAAIGDTRMKYGGVKRGGH